MTERHKPFANRETFEIEGITYRLQEVADLYPQLLLKSIESGHPRSSAYWSALAKAGYNRQDVMSNCETWGIDPGILTQM